MLMKLIATLHMESIIGAECAVEILQIPSFGHRRDCRSRLKTAISTVVVIFNLSSDDHLKASTPIRVVSRTAETIKRYILATLWSFTSKLVWSWQLLPSSICSAKVILHVSILTVTDDALCGCATSRSGLSDMTSFPQRLPIIQSHSSVPRQTNTHQAQEHKPPRQRLGNLQEKDQSIKNRIDLSGLLLKR